MRYTGIFLVGSLFLASVAPARDFYVDNVGGDDRFDGAAPAGLGGGSGPCRTIAVALGRASPGDRIVLTATSQPYRESVTLQAARHCGMAQRPFEIVGNGAILHGAAPIPGDAWEHVRNGVFRFRPPRMSYQMLWLDGKPAARVPVERSGLALPELKPLEWCLFEQAIHFRPEAGRLPDSYNLEYAALPVGITLYEVRDVVIRDLIVQGFQLDGINPHDGAYEIVVSGVTCRGNARSGISVGGASRIRIENCVVGANGEAQVRTEGQSHTSITKTKLLGITAPPLQQEGGSVHFEDAKAPAATASVRSASCRNS